MTQNELLQAIDVVLDRSAMAAGKLPGISVYADVNGSIHESVVGVERLLSRLDHMPPEDPPTDLVSKTLAFVERACGHDGRLSQPSLFNHSPLA